MGHLSVLSAHDCNLGGTVPANWSSQLQELQIIDLTNNLVSGMSQDSLVEPLLTSVAFLHASHASSHIWHLCQAVCFLHVIIAELSKKVVWQSGEGL